ncbi:MAG: adaptor protein MecA [Roseburia sp.]
MDIRRLGENTVRCTLSEDEIHDMGFEIDEIISDTSKTQEFMQEVLEVVEETENIRFEKLSPMVQAELLPNHQLAVTFGAEGEAEIRSIVDTIRQMMNGVASGKSEESKKQKEIVEEEAEGRKVCSLCFSTMNEVIQFSKSSMGLKLPMSALYRLKEEYELILDFTDFTDDEIKSYAFVTGEYGKHYEFGEARVAYIMEHGNRILDKEAIEVLSTL